jgi:Protein of unknown function (DUF3667)
MPHPTPDKKLVTCKNCGNSFHGHYCNACGQDAHSGKIDKHFLYHEIQHGLLHIDGGILYTLKELFTHPGETIRLFIQGKRVRHFKPLAFLVVMAGLYAFVDHYLSPGSLVNINTDNKNANQAMEVVREFMRTHYVLCQLVQLPILSFVFYLTFKKYGTNYIEQLVINTYLTGQRIAISLVLMPLMYLIVKNGHFIWYAATDMAIPILLFIWAYPQYYNMQPRAAITWRCVLAYIINYIIYLVLLSIIESLLATFPKMIA